MKRSTPPSAVHLCLALPLFVAAGACSKPPEGGATSAAAKRSPDEAPVVVTTTRVEEQALPRYLTLTGTLRADRQADVAADANGRVIATSVERGQAVRKGDVLAAVDLRAAEITQQAARAQVELAKSQAAQAKLECERAKKLIQTGAMTRAEYDQRMTNCEITASSLAAAEASAELAAKTLQDGLIRAPFTGMIGERFVNVGQYVRSDSRVVSLFAIDPLRLELTVPEASLAAVSKGAAVEFRVASYAADVFHGAIRFISPNVREASRDLVVEAVAENKDGRLKPGMFAIARLRVGAEPSAVVPKTAVRKGEVAASVFTVVGDRAIERIVQLGEDDGAMVGVTNLKKGEVIIATVTPELHDGAVVKVTE